MTILKLKMSIKMLEKSLDLKFVIVHIIIVFSATLLDRLHWRDIAGDFALSLQVY